MASDSDNYNDSSDVEMNSDEALLDSESEEEMQEVKEVEKKPAPIKKKEAYDPKYAIPTEAENQLLRNAGSLIQSNILDMQVDELLKNVSVDGTKNTKLNTFLKELQSVINGIKDQEVRADEFKDPSVELRNHGKKPVQFLFKKPTRMDIFGSYLLKAGVNNNEMNIDIGIQIPDSCIVPKDYLNFRYFDKRAMYLSIVMKALKAKYPKMNIYYSYWMNDYFKPIINIELEKSFCKYHYTVRILPYISANVLDMAKLNATRNNVKIAQLAGDDDDVLESATSKSDMIPTDYYNNLILEDIYMSLYTKFIFATLKQFPSLIQVIQLFKIYLYQHSLSQYQDSINSFLMTMVLCLLYQQGVLHKPMNVNQMVKTCFDYFGHTYDPSRPLYMNHHEHCKYLCPTNKQTLYILDTTYLTSYNVAFRVTEHAFADFLAVVRETLTTYEQYGNNPDMIFNYLYMNKTFIYNRYDQYFRVMIPAVSTLPPYQDGVINHPWNIYIRDSLAQLTSKALENRIQRYRMILPSDIHWTTEEKPKECQFLYICILLKPEMINVNQNRGPSADKNEECIQYRKFWGNKSQLRRYKDGSILETTTWTTSASETYKIPLMILNHIFKLHMPIFQSDVILLTDFFNQYLTMDADYYSTVISLNQSFDSLSEILREIHIEEENGGDREIEGFVQSVEPNSYEMSYLGMSTPSASPLLADASTNSKKALSRVIQPMFIVGNYHPQRTWGDNIELYAHKKQYLYLYIQRYLKKRAISSLVTPASLDILYNGYLFRLNLYVDKEVSILQKRPHLKTNLSRDQLVSNANYSYIYNTTKPYEDIPLFFDFYLNYLYMPRHLSVLKSLHNQYPSFSMSLKYLYIWYNAHQFSYSFPKYIFDSFMIYVYTHDKDNVPNSGFLGFYRCLLLLSTFKFDSHVLLIDPNHEMDTKAIKSLYNNMSKRRRAQANDRCLYICSPYDKESKATEYIDDRVLFKRLISLATQSIHLLHQYFSTNQYEEMKSLIQKLFISSTTDYDVKLELKQEILLALPPYLSKLNKKNKKSRGSSYLASEYRNLSRDYQHTLLTNYNPMLTIYQYLQKKLGEKCYLFVNELYGSTIYMVWRPNAFFCNHFTLTNSSYSFCIEDQKEEEPKKLLVTNIYELTNEILEECEDVIKNIQFI